MLRQLASSCLRRAKGGAVRPAAAGPVLACLGAQHPLFLHSRTSPTTAVCSATLEYSSLANGNSTLRSGRSENLPLTFSSMGLSSRAKHCYREVHRGQLCRSVVTKAAGFTLGGAVAVGAALAVRTAFDHTPLGHTLRMSALVIAGLNAVGFIATAATKSHKLTDLTGTTAFIGSAWATHYIACKAAGLAVLAPTKSLLMTALVTAWGARLAGYLFYRVLVVGEDARLRQFFPKDDREPALTGESRFPLKLAFFWTIQGMWAWVVLLPVTVSQALAPAVAIMPVGWACAGLFVTGLALESLADYQKFTFKNVPDNKGKFIAHGAFSWCRYPNYAGEIALWTGLWGLAQSGAAGLAGLHPWTAVSPAFTALLTLFISGIPMQEESHVKRYGNDASWKKYKNQTNMILPWPPAGKKD